MRRDGGESAILKDAIVKDALERDFRERTTSKGEQS